MFYSAITLSHSLCMCTYIAVVPLKKKNACLDYVLTNGIRWEYTYNRNGAVLSIDDLIQDFLCNTFY